MSDAWYYQRGDQCHGPVTSPELRRLAAAGELQPTDLLWREGMVRPLPASKTTGLFSPPTGKAPASLPRPGSAQTKMSQPRPPLPERRWFVLQGSRRGGPYSQANVILWLEERIVPPATIAMPVGSAQQKPLSNWPEFADAVARAEAAQSSAPATQQPSDPTAKPREGGTALPSVAPNQPVRSAKQLREAIVNVVLREEAPLCDVPAIRDFLRAHGASTAQVRSALERDQQITAAISAYALLEKALDEKKKEIAPAEAELLKMAQALGHVAFRASLSEKFGWLSMFAERLELHRKIADLEAEKLSLAPLAGAGLVRKARAKAQQVVILGKIKLAARSEGTLEAAIGKNLLHDNREETVRCDQTSGILDSICKQRSIIASHRLRVAEAQTALYRKRAELCRSLGIAKIEGASTLDDELRKCQTAINQNDKVRRDLENALPDKLLGEPDMPRHGPFAELLNELRQIGSKHSGSTLSGSASSGSKSGTGTRRGGMSLLGAVRYLPAELWAVCVATKEQTVRLAVYPARRFKAWRTATKGDTKAALWPSDRSGWRRIGIGYMAVAAILCAILFRIAPPRRQSIDPGKGVAPAEEVKSEGQKTNGIE